MKLLNTKAHAIFDYLFVLILFLSPRLFKLMDFAFSQPAVWIIPSLVALMKASLAVVSDYEGGLYRWIPMYMHRYTDMALGMLLLVSPWAFGFAPMAFIPHVVLGGAIVLVALFTRTEPRVEAAGKRSREPLQFKTQGHKN